MESLIEALKNVLIYGGSFILVLSLVVFVHEYGHFKAARICKVAVKSFSIGMGPAIAQRKDRHGTTWKIAAVPLGGFVSWVDDTDPSSTAPPSEEFRQLSPEEARARGHFRAQPVGARAFVVAAGPAMNFIFAIVVFALMLFAYGRDVTDNNALSPRLDRIEAGYPAAAAGLRSGDLVRAIDGTPVASFGQMQAIVKQSPGEQLALTVERNGETLIIPITPRPQETIDSTGVTSTVGLLGVTRLTLPEERTIERYGPLQSLAEGAKETWGIVARTGAYVANIFTGRASAEHIAGPAGILQASGQIASASISGEDTPLGERVMALLRNLLHWAAILSVAVGIVNLLPIPILDGGHLLFYGIEAVRGGKPLSLQSQEWALRIGLVMLGSLFLFATWNDIRRIFFS